MLLREHLKREWIERLVRDLERVGDSREQLEAWLGHPIREMTTEEHERLSDYVERAREAVAKGKKPPYLSPNVRR